MKKEINWPTQEALRALYPPQDESYMRAVRSTLANLEGEREVQPKMKKKMTFAVALAAVLMLALACTAVAAGMGAFAKIGRLWAAWGGDAYMEALNEKSVAIGETRTLAQDGAYPEVRLTLAQSYYDGENLFISYEATGLEGVIDYAWRPTQTELAQMDDVGAYGVTGEEGLTLDEAFVRAMVETAQREGCAGAAVYSTYLGDGVYLAGTDTYLDLVRSENALLEDGTFVGMREFGTPLPDGARDQDEVSMDIRVYRSVEWHYYDGEHWYFSWDLAGRKENNVTFTVPRNTHETAALWTAERTFEGYKAAAEVRVSGLKIAAVITVTELPGTAAVPDGLLDYAIYVNGERATMLSGEIEEDNGREVRMRFEFALPEGTLETVALVPRVLSEDAEIERPEETVTIEIGK